MDRRSFFKSVTNRVVKTAVDKAENSVNQQATRWIRPPYALAEIDFLLACTRCDQCVEACPNDVIFKLSSRLGALVMDTPALDLLNTGCQLCEDWPCVNACEAKALNLPDSKDDKAPALPLMARAEVNKETCLPYLGPECGACEYICPVPGALKWDMSKPIIDPEFCVGCGLCRQACILDPSAISISSLHQKETL
jgi:ferredoxin-type protein NapG